MSCYRLTRRANEDLEEIADYLGERSPAAVVRVLETLDHSFDFLSEHTGAGTSLEHLRPNLRVFSCPKPAHNYVIFFRPIKDGVQIAAVLHGSRDYQSMIASGEL